MNSSAENVFNSYGEIKHRVQLSAAFLRPVYQYTPQEIKNWQREEMLQKRQENYEELSDLIFD